MRLAIVFIALISVARANIAPDRTDVPRMISVMFMSGDTALFGLSVNPSLPAGTNGNVVSIQLQVAMKYYEVPLTACRALKEIHTETARFSDSEPVKRKDGTFSFTFRMGDEGTRRFGELPLVQISYAKGHFVDATVTRATAEHSYFSSPLCFAPL